MAFFSQDIRNFTMPWLDRVALQLEPKVQEAEKKYEYQTSRADLENSRILGLIIAASQPPSYGQMGLVNTHNVTNVHHHTHVSSPPLEPAEGTKKGKKKEEVNWKSIAVITFVATLITSASIYIHTRLAKAEQKAKNYLEKTKEIQKLANTFFHQNEHTQRLKAVADVQRKIDQNAVDKIKGYKHATLAALLGTVTIAAGAIATPWVATASTVAVIAGMTITAGSAMYATYNLASHWDDATDAKEQLNTVRADLAQLRDSNNYAEGSGPDGSRTAGLRNPYYAEELPPSYAASQAQYGYGYIHAEATAPTAPPLYPTLHDERY